MLKRLSRTTEFLIVVCVFLILVNVTLGLVLTRQSNAAMRALIESRMLDVSNTAAAMLDGDALERFTAEDRDTPEYRQAYETLSCFEENIALEYIYCVRAQDDGSFVYIMDPDTEDPADFGESIVYSDALYQAGQGTAAVDKVAVEDEWGRCYSAFSPVFDSAHRVAGIVGVDFGADWYEQQTSRQLRATLLVSGLSLFFAALIVTLVAVRSRRRFRQMLSTMNLVSDGIETLVHEISPELEMNVPQEESRAAYRDEIAELGARIQSLEKRLSRQISLVHAQAYVDGLTGLGNRAAYEEQVRQLDGEIAHAAADFTLVLFDLNGLKDINDRYGHDQGDQTLAAVGAALKQVFADGKVYRIGGDEFTAILAGAAKDLAARFEEIGRLLETQGAFTVSMGYAVFTPGRDADFRAVFKRADSAMYEAKNAYYSSVNAE